MALGARVRCYRLLAESQIGRWDATAQRFRREGAVITYVGYLMKPAVLLGGDRFVGRCYLLTGHGSAIGAVWVSGGRSSTVHVF